MNTNLVFYSENASYSILKNIGLLISDALTHKNLISDTLKELTEFSDRYHVDGNLWKKYITYTIMQSENIYSKSCELHGSLDGSINNIILNDFEVFYELYNFDLASISSVFSVITDYRGDFRENKSYSQETRDCINSTYKQLNMSHSTKEFKDIMTEFYKEHGTGKLGLHRAFRVEEDKQSSTIISPIVNFDPITFDDLIGYEPQKQTLIDNTRAFIEGKSANNCLLFGDAGTGKSSSVRAVLNKFYDDGLRIIEIYKHQLHQLNDIINQVKNRNYKFIIFMDDLSFEDFETEYKYLKAVIEGGLERKPDNVLIYATSNRRHLIKESFLDRQENQDDVHISDTTQEKLSLSARFGVTILFVRPLPTEFQNMVLELAKKNDIKMLDDKLLEEVNRWDLNHGGSRTGRTAQQFIDYILGQQ